MAEQSLAPDRFYVYVHSRLNTGEPFYVGKGFGRRACAHDSRSPHWKNIVAKDGGRYVNVIAENMDEDFAFFVEMEAIDKYRRAGVVLVNRTDGGDGPTGLKHSEASKLKMRAKRMSDEAKAKMRAAKLGKKYSAEHRKNMSISMKANKYVRKHPDMTGFKHSAESRAKMSAGMKGRVSANKGKPMLAHVRAALVEAQSRRTNFAHSDETKKKISAGNKGVKRSLETRAQMSKARRVSVRCVDTGEVFDCALSAALHFGCHYHTLVGQCCRGVIKSAHGHTFEYVRRENG